MSLSAMHIGQSGTVKRIAEDDPVRLRKLLAMGVLPGTEIQLVQKGPAYVFRLGYTVYAVDASMADQVDVELN